MDNKSKITFTNNALDFKIPNTMLSNLHASNLTIIASPPSMGKTSFALSVASQVVTSGCKTVIFFSLDMQKEQLIHRMTDLKLNSYSNLIVNDTPGLSFSELSSICKNQKSNYDLDMIIIDYLWLMKFSTSAVTVSQELSSIINSFKSLADELQITIILLSTLPREVGVEPETRPRLKNLVEAGYPTDCIDVVLFLYREEYYDTNSKSQGITEVILAKNTFGDTETIYLNWSPISY